MTDAAKRSQPIRVLVVDDHPVVREGMRAMLDGEPGIAIVGGADSGEQALEQIGQLTPDVVLTDLRMPGMSGIDLTRRIKEKWPSVAVIFLTMYDSSTFVVAALRAGAAGYLLKDSSRELVIHAITAVLDGGTLVRSGLLRLAIQGVTRTQTGGDELPPLLIPAEPLTARELEVLRLVIQGNHNTEIARELFLAEVTVKKHVQSIIAKLGGSDRTHAAILAMRLGLVD